MEPGAPGGRMGRMNDPDPLARIAVNSEGVAVFSMRQAAKVTGVSISTLRRRRAELEDAGAVVTPEGWQVPITALEAVGLMGSGVTSEAPKAPETPAPRAVDAATDDDVHTRLRELEDEVLEQRHRTELAALRQRAELAEERQRFAEQRLRDALGTLEHERRMLMAGPITATTAPETPEPPPPAPEQTTPGITTPRPSRWRRWFG